MQHGLLKDPEVSCKDEKIWFSGTRHITPPAMITNCLP